jgi:4-hydroxy-tetrahydrodipicolinate reductase
MPLADGLRVAVLGAAGRMGRTVATAVAASPDLELVAAVDPMSAGVVLSFGDGVEPMVIESDLVALTAASVEVAIDFTAPRAAAANLAWLAAHDIHAVCGTTGLSDAEIRELTQAFSRSDGPNAVLAANFAISAVLMMHLAAIAAPFFDNIEIVEFHHEHKVDAPSGTAVATAAAIDEARSAAGAGALGEDPTTTETMPGARGARSAGGVQLHAVRLAGLVAHQEVLLGTTGQSLTIRQDSYDRSSFMPGVLLATRKVASTPGFTRGLESLLGL